MKASLFLPFCLFPLLLGSIATGADDQPTVTSMTQEMSFEDQKGATHHLKFPLKRPMMVTLAGQFGAAHVEKWIAPVASDHLEDIYIVGIANLEGVPDFMKDALRKGFQKNSAQWPIFLDWEGVGYKAFQVPKNKISVFLLSASGDVAWSYTGPPDKEKLDSLKDSIKGLLVPAEPETATTQS